jgi:hypothetical protein
MRVVHVRFSDRQFRTHPGWGDDELDDSAAAGHRASVGELMEREPPEYEVSARIYDIDRCAAAPAIRPPEQRPAPGPHI